MSQLNNEKKLWFYRDLYAAFARKVPRSLPIMRKLNRLRSEFRSLYGMDILDSRETVMFLMPLLVEDIDYYLLFRLYFGMSGVSNYDQEYVNSMEVVPEVPAIPSVLSGGFHVSVVDISTPTYDTVEEMERFDELMSELLDPARVVDARPPSPVVGQKRPQTFSSPRREKVSVADTPLGSAKPVGFPTLGYPSGIHAPLGTFRQHYDSYMACGDYLGASDYAWDRDRDLALDAILKYKQSYMWKKDPSKVNFMEFDDDMIRALEDVEYRMELESERRANEDDAARLSRLVNQHRPAFRRRLRSSKSMGGSGGSSKEL